MLIVPDYNLPGQVRCSGNTEVFQKSQQARTNSGCPFTQDTVQDYAQTHSTAGQSPPSEPGHPGHIGFTVPIQTGTRAPEVGLNATWPPASALRTPRSRALCLSRQSIQTQEGAHPRKFRHLTALLVCRKEYRSSFFFLLVATISQSSQSYKSLSC